MRLVLYVGVLAFIRGRATHKLRSKPSLGVWPAVILEGYGLSKWF